MRGLIAAFAFCATQAQALSCLPVDPVASYIQARDSEDTYVLARGSLQGRPDFPEKSLNDQMPETIRFTAQFTGHRVSTQGFNVPFETPVEVSELCFGPWCARVPDQSDAVLFMRKTDSGWALDEGPCGGWVFGAPSDDTIADLTRCAQGGRCQPEFPR